jgi:hypothetical protein
VGHVVERGDVGGDVLTGATVAPRRGLDEAPGLVADGDGDAVDLELADVGRVGRARLLGHPALETLPPGHELVEVEGVVERHHRHRMGHG